MKNINTETEYKKAMSEILKLMNKGEDNLTKTEALKIKVMAASAQAYEQRIYTIEPPKTLEGMIELKMYERKLKQKDLARLMGLSESKLSQVLSGKRQPDVAFLKAAHKKLGIDAAFLLNHV
ncbi:MAG: helix-turn-helix domain-containing protein [Chitinophagaceae bacterium]|nr:helix-turn-helix domain-containing protein [Chitinophagaceae bacterium]